MRRKAPTDASALTQLWNCAEQLIVNSSSLTKGIHSRGLPPASLYSTSPSCPSGLNLL